jgi:hypothetical protein
MSDSAMMFNKNLIQMLDSVSRRERGTGQDISLLTSDARIDYVLSWKIAIRAARPIFVVKTDFRR